MYLIQFLLTNVFPTDLRYLNQPYLGKIDTIVFHFC